MQFYTFQILSHLDSFEKDFCAVKLMVKWKAGMDVGVVTHRPLVKVWVVNFTSDLALDRRLGLVETFRHLLRVLRHVRREEFLRFNDIDASLFAGLDEAEVLYLQVSAFLPFVVEEHVQPPGLGLSPGPVTARSSVQF